MLKIDGKKIAEEIISELKKEPIPKKFLAVFFVGDDKATESFISQKEKTAKELGVDFRVYKFKKDITNDDFRAKIRQIVLSKLCGGAVLQLPLPPQLNPLYVLNAIPPDKDVDVLSRRLRDEFENKKSKIVPPSVGTVMEILKRTGIEIGSLKSVAVLGQGTLVGKPISSWFTGKVPEVLRLDKGDDISVLKRADLVILGTGAASLIKADFLKKGAGVIDFGYGQKQTADGKLKIGGDFDADSIGDVGDDYLSFYTPTPGGTGPILVARLFKNFFELNKD